MKIQSETLIPGEKEIAEPARALSENRSKFRLEDFESDYLDNLLHKENVANQVNAISTPSLPQNEVDQIVERTVSRNEEKSSRRSTAGKEIKVKNTKKGREEILKEIPQVDY